MIECTSMGCNRFSCGSIGHDKNCVNYPESLQSMVDDKNDEIQQLREQVKQLESEREWISVKDRLPELRDNVLCANSSGDVFKCMWQGHQFKIDCTVWECSNVTHWMPLPEPPKELKQ